MCSQRTNTTNLGGRCCSKNLSVRHWSVPYLGRRARSESSISTAAEFKSNSLAAVTVIFRDVGICLVDHKQINISNSNDGKQQSRNTTRKRGKFYRHTNAHFIPPARSPHSPPPTTRNTVRFPFSATYAAARVCGVNRSRPAGRRGRRGQGKVAEIAPAPPRRASPC